MKRLIVAVVILVVVIVMALRGCPRGRRSAGMAHDSATADVTVIPIVSGAVVSAGTSDKEKAGFIGSREMAGID
ncbi:MAG: hypothetical protein M1497_04385 [Nitrospirae bacterium]|nr:hypothetical protein [Nitrospirota bacterium]